MRMHTLAFLFFAALSALQLRRPSAAALQGQLASWRVLQATDSKKTLCKK